VSAQETRRWAYVYADLGWRVFPVVPGEKRPMYAGWQRDATTDHDLVNRWWRRDPAPNIGVVTGEAFVAFDIEAQHLDRFRAALTTQLAPLPATPIARTGRGGVHILARVPFIEGGRAIEGGRDLYLGGVHIGELKAQGGFIVAAPSVTRGAYGWHVAPEDALVADAPDWLLRLVASRPKVVHRAPARLGPSRALALAAALYRVVADAPEGRRNDLLFWASCRVAERGLDAEAATDVLLAAALRAGLDEREARATIASGLRR
jgi:hypothetical protein